MSAVPDRAATDVVAAADTLQKLAVLLEAGIAPDRAWLVLATDREAPAGHVGEAAAGDIDAMRERGGVWEHVAVAWQVAQTVGAPLAGSLRQFAFALRSAAEVRDDIDVALADPRATARLIAWLPAVAIVLGVALGFDVGRVLVQPLGIVCVAAGVTLMVVARVWTRRLVRRATPDASVVGVQSEVIAIALSGGVSVDRALAVARAAGAGEVETEVERLLALSQRAGARAVDLLRAHAAEQRRAARTHGRLRAARLGARLLLPMGVCTLPAFLLLGVAPLLLSVVGGAAPPLFATVDASPVG